MSADEILDTFGAMPLTHFTIIVVTLAYIFSYGWLLIHLVQTWRLKRGMP